MIRPGSRNGELGYYLFHGDSKQKQQPEVLQGQLNDSARITSLQLRKGGTGTNWFAYLPDGCIIMHFDDRDMEISVFLGEKPNYGTDKQFPRTPRTPPKSRCQGLYGLETE